MSDYVPGSTWAELLRKMKSESNGQSKARIHPESIKELLESQNPWATKPSPDEPTTAKSSLPRKARVDPDSPGEDPPKRDPPKQASETLPGPAKPDEDAPAASPASPSPSISLSGAPESSPSGSDADTHDIVELGQATAVTILRPGRPILVTSPSRLPDHTEPSDSSPSDAEETEAPHATVTLEPSETDEGPPAVSPAPEDRSESLGPIAGQKTTSDEDLTSTPSSPPAAEPSETADDAGVRTGSSHPRGAIDEYPTFVQEILEDRDNLRRIARNIGLDITDVTEAYSDDEDAETVIKEPMEAHNRDGEDAVLSQPDPDDQPDSNHWDPSDDFVKLIREMIVELVEMLEQQSVSRETRPGFPMTYATVEPSAAFQSVIVDLGAPPDFEFYLNNCIELEFLHDNAGPPCSLLSRQAQVFAHAQRLRAALAADLDDCFPLLDLEMEDRVWLEFPFANIDYERELPYGCERWLKVNWRGWQAWVEKETEDGPIQIGVPEIRELKTIGSLSECPNSFAPLVKPAHNPTTVGFRWSACLLDQRPFREDYGPSNLTDEMETNDSLPGVRGALTPTATTTTNNDHNLPAAPDATTTTASPSTVEVQPGASHTHANDEQQYFALLEFRADPVASLQRRLKEKLGHLSKKQRKEIAEVYLARQQEELELDALREINGTNASPLAVVTTWEVEDEPVVEPVADEEEQEGEEKTAAPMPTGTYGYVPQRPVQAERDLWREYWDNYYSMSRSDRAGFVQGLVWYGFELALHAGWYAGREAHVRRCERGEAVWDPASCPEFPPNPASDTAAAQLQPNVVLGFSVLPFGSGAAATLHLAGLVVASAKYMVELLRREAMEWADEVRACPRPVPHLAEIAEEFAATLELCGQLVGTINQAAEMGAAALERAVRLGVFDVEEGEEDTEVPSVAAAAAAAGGGCPPAVDSEFFARAGVPLNEETVLAALREAEEGGEEIGAALFENGDGAGGDQSSGIQSHGR